MITLLLHFHPKSEPLMFAPLVMIAATPWVMRTLNLQESASSHRLVYIYVAPTSE